jgi:hypothetical protein
MRVHRWSPPCRLSFRNGLHHAEIVGMALAQRGEDGMGELVRLLDSDDFVLRHKAVIGLSTLGRRALGGSCSGSAAREGAHAGHPTSSSPGSPGAS